MSAFSFGTGVAKTVGSGMVDLSLVTPYVILSGLIGAIVWDLITWWFGSPDEFFPRSVRRLCRRRHGERGRCCEGSSIVGSHRGERLDQTLVFMVAAPIIGLVLAYAFMVAVYWAVPRSRLPRRWTSISASCSSSSAAIYSYAHGTNDAQKTMGIITGVLVTGGYLKTFEVPIWVILSAHAAIALGTLTGGWRIVHTMGARLTRLRPRSGFCAEAAAAASILLATD